MKKAKKRAIIIITICLIVLIGAFIADMILGKSYLKELKYSQFVEKMENKESFVLLLSQTTCSHCKDFKPKLDKIAKKYKITIYYMETDLLDKDTYDTFKKKYFNFDGTPTTVFVINGEEKTAASRIDGDVSKEKIISKLKSNGFIS